MNDRELYREAKHSSRSTVAKARETQRVKFANEVNTEEGEKKCVKDSKTEDQGETKCWMSKLLEKRSG